MLKCDEEISQYLENMVKGIPMCSLHTIQEYIECAKKKNLEARYFPVVNCGFIIYEEKTIFLTAEEGGTILSLNPMIA